MRCPFSLVHFIDKGINETKILEERADIMKTKNLSLVVIVIACLLLIIVYPAGYKLGYKQGYKAGENSAESRVREKELTFQKEKEARCITIQPKRMV